MSRRIIGKEAPFSFFAFLRNSAILAVIMGPAVYQTWLRIKGEY